MSFTFQAVLGTIAVVWEVKKNFVLLLGGKSFYLTYGKGFKRGAAYLHFFLLCCHDYVAVKWGFRSDFQKATPSPYSLPIAFKWWLIIEDK